MLNCYCGLDDLTNAMKGGSTAADKAVALRVIEAVSRAVDRGLERRFYHEEATAYFDGNGMRRLPLSMHANEQGRGDLLSVTTLKVDDNRDGVYELTLTENTDFKLANKGDGGAYRRLDVLWEWSTRISYWAAFARYIEVVGVWGYSQETEAAGTLGAAIADTTTTSVTMAAGHAVQAGNTIVVDSEQLFVSAVATNTLTVVRGVNGSTAASHLSGASVARRRYPRPIELAVQMEAARLIRDGLTGFSGQVANPEFAGYAFQAVYPAIADLKRTFHPTGTVVAV